MSLILAKPAGQKLTLAKTYVGIDDPDAANYIALVEAADTAAGSPGGLETATKVAIHSFVKGCKADGILGAIKASCILAGARTLAGALVPLVGAAPTNFNFVAGDYNRKTGLAGNGSTKYLNSNRNNNSDPQNSAHRAAWLSAYSSGDQYLLGTETSIGSHDFLLCRASSAFFRSRFSGSGTESVTAVGSEFSGGLFGMSRSIASQVSARYRQSSGMVATTISTTSAAPNSDSLFVLRSGSQYSSSRLAFYSIGESLDLALLDARVTTLITALGAAIP